MWPQHLCSSSLQEGQGARSGKSAVTAGGVDLGRLLLPCGLEFSLSKMGPEYS